MFRIIRYSKLKKHSLMCEAAFTNHSLVCEDNDYAKIKKVYDDIKIEEKLYGEELYIYELIEDKGDGRIGITFKCDSVIYHNKIKPVANKYGYKFIHIDTNQYKLSKDYKHLKLIAYLRFNEFDKANNYFYFIETHLTTFGEKEIDEIINAKEIIHDDMDKMIKELNKND